ncbi:ABC-three component system protein [Sphingomonas sp. Leaf28]|uniref:ABC-three component system protein n=1 Tax=Sphingomonas sp. Leaf28 TaxID=1735695 RepID=UPI0006FDB433|nr:ABC-three component system protein [Sphingomonas sp. Leaf28]KQN08873.1 hypothetical protein ASE79_13335 [Sphingomonas sp. Leaf28]
MRYHREVLALDDESLERFVRDWIALKTSDFVEVERFAGAGDLGRDVVGFRTGRRHEGAWENYQCKQYGRSLQTGEALVELGKILHFVNEGEFSLPAAYHFVVPRGMGRELEKLVFNPTQLKAELISRWDTACAKKIARGQTILLTPKLQATIDAFDFSKVTRVTVDGILGDKNAKPVLAKWFGADPGAPPRGTVPSDVDVREQAYLSQLIDAYGERAGSVFADHAAVAADAEHGPHLLDQRKRFFEADAFDRFYRDNTLEEDLEALHDEVYHGVIGPYRGVYSDSLARVEAVMNQAAAVKPAGLLANHARVPVRQGFCHHFANDGRFVWKR